MGGLLTFLSIGYLINFRVGLHTINTSLILDEVSSGTLIGMIIGIYYNKLKLRNQRLSNKNKRIKKFADKTADLNKYTELIQESDSIDDISAYSIQVISSLIGYSNTFFFKLTKEKESPKLIQKTVDKRDKDIKKIAKEYYKSIVDQEDNIDTNKTEITIKESKKGEFWLIIPVIRKKPLAIILVEIKDISKLKKEDKKLLEILSQHIAIALSRQ
ncbi:MAG: hypothetical protein BTN85_1455 [Candidatus Methanohalarchaeum thermophilum]|uniref:GAF domain-containing protein n=1 Tax=Methanohalarchaeum thermophilum TaxID=1903181 RepID=A0A1Q6DX66_METT1|nr:MAG: hypothetical protein BTN85_1455 [Candidatus Methanohalarchaeum thermophilum]